MAKDQRKTIKSMQDDEDYIIVNNPIRLPQFGIRQKNGIVKNAKATTHISKVFWEAISLLDSSDLENITRGQAIIKTISIGNLVQKIGTEGNYKYVIDAARMLRAWEVMLIDDDDNTTYTGFFTEVKHIEKKGLLEVQMSQKWVKYILDIVQKGNFSFEKNFILTLQNVGAIRLYPFLKSWLNKGVYDTSLDRFKKDFGYDTSGYSKFSKLKEKVLDPAMREINEKTDILVRYELKGESLDTQKPRVSGLTFYIKAKEKQETKQLEAPKAVERPQKPIDEPQHISQVIQAKTLQSPQKPNTSKIEPSFNDIRVLVPDTILTDEQIQVFINDFGYIRTWEIIKGFKELKNIQSPFAYIKTSSKDLGLGLWQRQKNRIKKQQEEKEHTLLKTISDGYEAFQTSKIRENYKNALELYPELIEQIKNNLLSLPIETQKRKKVRTFEGHINPQLERVVGRELLLLSETPLLTLKNVQGEYRNKVFNEHQIQIDFTEAGKIIKISLFDEPKEAVEEAVFTELPIEPLKPKVPKKPRTKKPQAQKPIETKRSKADEKQEAEQEPQPTQKKKFWERLFG